METTPVKYQYAPGFHAPQGLPADVAAAELENVRKTSGELIPENVVNAARSKTNPLHLAFEWDDSIAGQRFRLHQASQLTRSITIVRETYEQPFRYFTLVRGDDQPRASYLPTEVVVQRSDLYEDGLARLKRELTGAQKSVQELIMLATIAGAKQSNNLTKVSNLLQKATDLVK